MAKNDKNKEVDINEVAITYKVDSDVVNKVRSGEITHLIWEIDEDNQNLFLETVNGNLILVTDEMPETFHGCYLYNNGEFPYARWLVKDKQYKVTLLHIPISPHHSYTGFTTIRWPSCKITK